MENHWGLAALFFGFLLFLPVGTATGEDLKDLKSEQERLVKELEQLEHFLLTPKRRYVDLKAEINQIEKWLLAAKNGELPAEATGRESYQKEKKILQDRVGVEEALLKETQADYELKKKEHERIKKLVMVQAATRAELQKAEAELEIRATKKTFAENALEKTKQDLKSFPIAFLTAKKGEVQSSLKETEAQLAEFQDRIERLVQKQKELERRIKQAESR